MPVAGVMRQEHVRMRHKSRGLRIIIASTVFAFLGLAQTQVALATHSWNGYHWKRYDTAVAQVYVTDHTGTRWPVNAAANKWNESARLGVYWVAPGNCPMNCAHTWEGNYGASGWYGLTTIDLIAGTKHFKSGHVKVQFNNYYATTSDQRRSIACHELGHVIGLWEEYTRTTSCMWHDSQYFPLYPHSHDYDMLWATYDHVG